MKIAGLRFRSPRGYPPLGWPSTLRLDRGYPSVYKMT
jgi:hypothetical protein